MPQNHNDELHKRVQQALDAHGLPAFKRQWESYKEMFGGLEVRAYFLVAEADYAGVGILTDGMVLDLEGKDGIAGDQPIRNNINCDMIDSFGGVTFVEGEVPGIPQAKNAKLTVLARYGTDMMLAWAATSDQQVVELRSFSKALLAAITRSRKK